MLTDDHRTHPNDEIDLNKCDPGHALCLRELPKYGLDAHIADVNIAGTARCEPSSLQNDVGFVEGWMVMVMVALLPSAVVECEGEDVA